MIRPEFIIEELRKNMPDADLEQVWRAYAFAARCHKGQKRVSGEPYLSHPLEVAYILAKMKLGHQSVSAGLLHDTIEDTFATPEEIRQMFGDEVFQLVDGVTKISLIEFSSQEERQAENVRKMILAMSKDIRVILIKLADRIHNMRTLDYLNPVKQRQIAQETLDIYAPLANRLGIGWMKTELENASFKYLWPKEYSEIKHRVETVEAEREKYLDKIVAEVDARMKQEGLKVEVRGRPKHFYSVFSKMQKQNISFEEVFDLMGVRIIAGSDQECYRILGVLHNIYKPIPGKLKDYIALPKENMYQSLHTTIVGPEGKPVEFQIRTKRMHQLAEEGIAAHWRYKEGAKEGKHDDQIMWLRRLMEWQQEVKHPREFLEKVKIDLFPDEVYVFTPKQEVKAFPRGATPIDFAYSIHTDLGHNLIGAKVNGKLVSLRHELKNGDIIEILTSKQARPSRDWLKYVKTSKARTKISSYLRQAEKSRALELGREMLEKEFDRIGLSPAEHMDEKVLQEGAQAAGYQSVESMFVALGLGKLKMSQLMAKLAPKEVYKEKKKTVVSALWEKLREKPSKAVKPTAGVRIQDMDDLLIHFAKCCNPVPGDAIRGFISRGRGLVVHTADCPNALNLGLDSERSVEVEWDVKAAGKHPAMLAVETEDRPGMLASVSSAIAEAGSNITEATIRASRDKKGYIYITMEIEDLKHLQKIMNAVMRLKGVRSVERIRDRSAVKSHRKGKEEG